MSTQNRTKINRLLSLVPPGGVMLASWLLEHGYSRELQKRYCKSNWLESIGRGAFKRTGEKVGYEGAIYALQHQAGVSIHPGGPTALSMLGKRHYLELAPRNAILFGATTETLPAWFKNQDWGLTIDYYRTSFLPPELGLKDFELKTFRLKISSAARALMECLYLAHGKQPLLESYQIMESLNNLRPKEVQNLLEANSSIKVKRLFLYMAEKAGHGWVKHLNTSAINLGSGKRSLVDHGVYVAKYQITVPKELEPNGSTAL